MPSKRKAAEKAIEKFKGGEDKEEKEEEEDVEEEDEEPKPKKQKAPKEPEFLRVQKYPVKKEHHIEFHAWLKGSLKELKKVPGIKKNSIMLAETSAEDALFLVMVFKSKQDWENFKAGDVFKRLAGEIKSQWVEGKDIHEDVGTILDL